MSVSFFSPLMRAASTSFQPPRILLSMNILIVPMMSMGLPEASNISRALVKGFTSAPMPSPTAVVVMGKVQPVSMTPSVSVSHPPYILEYTLDLTTEVSSSLATLGLYAV